MHLSDFSDEPLEEGDDKSANGGKKGGNHWGKVAGRPLRETGADARIARIHVLERKAAVAALFVFAGDLTSDPTGCILVA